MLVNRLEQAKELYENGKITEAQELLWSIIDENLQDEIAWLWYAHTFSTYEEQIQVLEECLRFNPDSETVRDRLATLRSENENKVQESSELSETFQGLLRQVKPYLEKFGAWFNKQEGVVKAAVVSAIGLFLTVFITGCFSLIAATISRPTSQSSIIITATLQPTPTPFFTPTPNPFLTPPATSTTQAKSSDPLFVPPTPILIWLNNQSKIMSSPMQITLFGVLGGILVSLGLWQIWLIFLNKNEKNKDTIFSSLLTVISIFIAWQILGWLAVLIGVVGTFGILVLIFGLIFSAILHIPYLGGSIVGAVVGIFLGIGSCFIYFAVSDLFVAEYVNLAIIIGSSAGAILGLILSSINTGLWHSPSSNLEQSQSTNET